jgi:hypothetical protein
VLLEGLGELKNPIYFLLSPTQHHHINLRKFILVFLFKCLVAMTGIDE